jgi:hypothetical protein
VPAEAMRGVRSPVYTGRIRVYPVALMACEKLIFSVWCPGEDYQKTGKSRAYRVPLLSSVPLSSKRYF